MDILIYLPIFNSIFNKSNLRMSIGYLQPLVLIIIIHQTHYEKSDWSRAFNQFTIACELDMINAISAEDIAFNMSSSTSAWLLSPLEYSLLFLRMNYMKNRSAMRTCVGFHSSLIRFEEMRQTALFCYSVPFAQ